jgi:phospholipase/carboxylesterase
LIDEERMNPHDLIVQRPAAPRQLVLLFHGVGSSARDLVPLGEALAPHLVDAAIVSVQAPEALGRGWQWFSVQGVTEADRPARVAAAMPGFVQAVMQWQEDCDVSPAQTTLIGFSQGAIMALEATQLDSLPAACVIALSGRFARPPRIAHESVRMHLMHGDADGVMPVRGAVDALLELQGIGAVATLDRFPGLGHGIDTRVVDAIVRRLNDRLPDRLPTALELEVDFVTAARMASRVGSVEAPRTTLLHLGDEDLVVLDGQGDKPETVHRLALGPVRLGREFFHHDPPTPQEIERAIDFTEDEIMRLGKPTGIVAPLFSTARALRPWADLSGPTMTIAVVEQWFQRLASASLGQRGAMQGLPAGRDAAATLLVLREFMHHRGHDCVVAVQPAVR